MLEDRIMYEQKSEYILFTIDMHLPIHGSNEDVIKETLFTQFKQMKRGFSSNADVLVLPDPKCIVYQFLGKQEITNRVHMQVKLLNAINNNKFIKYLRWVSAYRNMKLGMFTRFAFIDNIPSSEAKYENICNDCGSKIITVCTFNISFVLPADLLGFADFVLKANLGGRSELL